MAVACDNRQNRRSLAMFPSEGLLHAFAEAGRDVRGEVLKHSKRKCVSRRGIIDAMSDSLPSVLAFGVKMCSIICMNVLSNCYGRPYYMLMICRIIRTAHNRGCIYCNARMNMWKIAKKLIREQFTKVYLKEFV